MEEKELWMSKLKEKLADYSEPTPDSGWEQLEKELIPPVEKKIYPYRRWTMAAAAVILLAIVSSLSLYFLGTPAADEIRHIKTPVLASSPDALPGIDQPDTQGTIITPLVSPAAKDRLAKTEVNRSEGRTEVTQRGIKDERLTKIDNDGSPTVDVENKKDDELIKQPEEVSSYSGKTDAFYSGKTNK